MGVNQEGFEEQYREFLMYEGSTRRKIISRGMWDVIIRPQTFVRERVGILKLYPLLKGISARGAGFQFPLLREDGDYRIYLDAIGQDVEIENRMGSWQFFQSGFFADRSGMWLDWRDQTLHGAPEGWQPCVALGIAEAVLRFTAIFEMASRLAFSLKETERIHMQVKIAGLHGRQLHMDYPVTNLISAVHMTSLVEFPLDKEYLRSELRQGHKRFALDAARELFMRFGWDPPQETLKELQSLWQ